LLSVVLLFLSPMRSLRAMPAPAHPVRAPEDEPSAANPLDEPTLPLGQAPL